MILSAIQTADAYRQGNKIFIGKRKSKEVRLPTHAVFPPTPFSPLCLQNRILKADSSHHLPLSDTFLSLLSPVSSPYSLLFSPPPLTSPTLSHFFRLKSTIYSSHHLLYQNQQPQKSHQRKMERNIQLHQFIVLKLILEGKIKGIRLRFMSGRERLNWDI